MPRGWGRESGVRGGGGRSLAAQTVSEPKPELGGGGGGATPLCPSTSPGAKGKFSVLENHQEWGRGPAWGRRPSKHFPGAGDEAPGIQDPPGSAFSSWIEGRVSLVLAQFAGHERRGQALVSHSPVVARGPEQSPRPRQPAEGTGIRQSRVVPSRV